MATRKSSSGPPSWSEDSGSSDAAATRFLHADTDADSFVRDVLDKARAASGATSAPKTCVLCRRAPCATPFSFCAQCAQCLNEYGDSTRASRDVSCCTAQHVT